MEIAVFIHLAPGLNEI